LYVQLAKRRNLTYLARIVEEQHPIKNFIIVSFINVTIAIKDLSLVNALIVVQRTITSLKRHYSLLENVNRSNVEEITLSFHAINAKSPFIFKIFNLALGDNKIALDVKRY
jgi:hypothetical protein